MLKLFKVEDTVRIPPSMFGSKLKEVAEIQLREKYENIYDEEMGYILLVSDVKVSSIGRVMPDDGSSYHKVNFKVYAFKPLPNEIIEGEVVEVASFGVFVRVGPLDSLLHISQIMDDYVSVDVTQGIVIGRDTQRTIRVGDRVRARVVAVSPPKGVSVGKIGLTARQPFLGKVEWIEEKVREIEEKINEE